MFSFTHCMASSDRELQRSPRSWVIAQPVMRAPPDSAVSYLMLRHVIPTAGLTHPGHLKTSRREGLLYQESSDVGSPA